MGDADRAVLGRDAELAEIDRFIGSVPSGPRAIVFEGTAGIGKTTLWLAAVGTATKHGHRVLSTRAAEAEARLSYTALGDLLDGVIDDAQARLPLLKPGRWTPPCSEARSDHDLTNARCPSRPWRSSGSWHRPDR